MRRFIEGADRTQVSLLPECVEDYVEAENPVRVIEAFVEQLDLRVMGFEGGSIRRRRAGQRTTPPCC
jgi:transposase